MLDTKTIRELFEALDVEMGKLGARGEIGLCGGAVMCLVFEARKSTKDVDAIFHPTSEIRKAAKAVAARFDLPEDWLNDAAQGFFLSDPSRQTVLEFDHLRVWAPRADYMLAMKCVSARFDTHDRDDVAFLIRHLGLRRPGQVLAIIRRYYPRGRIPPKARFLVEELLGGK